MEAPVFGAAAAALVFGAADSVGVDADAVEAPFIGGELPGALGVEDAVLASFGAGVLVAGRDAFFATPLVALDETVPAAAAGDGCGCCCERLLVFDALVAGGVSGCFLGGTFSAALVAGCCLATIAGVCVTGCEDAGFGAAVDEAGAAVSPWAEVGS